MSINIDLNYLSDGRPVKPYVPMVNIPEAVLLGEWKFVGNSNDEYIDFSRKADEPDAFFSYQGSHVNLIVDEETDGKKATLQTTQYVHYIIGTKNIFFITFNPNSVQKEFIKRVGVFDDDDGIFLELGEDGIKIIVRGGTVGEIPRSSWNVNKMDGSSELEFEDDSPVNLNFSALQTLVIAYDWSAGFFSVGFVIEGEIVIAHHQTFNNVANLPFMGRPNLPVRFEIFSIRFTSEIGSLSAYSCCAYREGSTHNHGGGLRSDSASVTLGGGASSTILAIRVASGAKINARLKDIHFNSISGNLLYKLTMFGNSDAMSGSWVGVDSSKCQKIAGGTVPNYASGALYRQSVSGAVSVGQSTRETFKDNKSLTIGTNIDLNNGSVLAVVATNMDGLTSSTGLVSLSWDELL